MATFERLASKLPKVMNPREGAAFGRIAIKAETQELDLLDNNGNATITHFDSSGVAVGGQPTYDSTNSKISGEDSLVFTGQSDANEYISVVFATPFDLSQLNFVNLWVWATTSAFSAGDYEIEFRNGSTVLLTEDLRPPVSANIQTVHESDISALLRTKVTEVRIRKTTSNANVIELQNLLAYDYSNGKGPVYGECEIARNVGAALSRGDIVVKTIGYHNGVEVAAGNDSTAKGPCVIGGATDANVMFQVTGDAYMEVDDAANVAAGDAVSPTGSGTVDNDTTGVRMGTFLEAGDDDEHVLVALGR
jgi:hypothetical protein